jgi:hypothetical protein
VSGPNLPERLAGAAQAIESESETKGGTLRNRAALLREPTANRAKQWSECGAVIFKASHTCIDSTRREQRAPSIQRPSSILQYESSGVSDPTPRFRDDRVRKIAQTVLRPQARSSSQAIARSVRVSVFEPCCLVDARAWALSAEHFRASRRGRGAAKRHCSYPARGA